MLSTRLGVGFMGGRFQRRKNERGQILVLFEIVLIVILVFAAMVIDLGFLRNDRQTLVNAIDAGALAGGTVLPVTGPTEATKANGLIKTTVESSFAGLTSSNYTIDYKCLVPVDTAGTGPDLTYIPSSCDPRSSLLGNANGTISSLAPYFTGAGAHRYSSCNPSAGDKCNVVVVTGSKITNFNLGPIIGVNNGSTGSISSAACVGIGCGAVGPPRPADLVVILDRTGSMADGNDKVGAKIQALRLAAETVLGSYDPTIQRIALGLTGPGQGDSSGNAYSASCPNAGGTGYGVNDDNNFAPSTTLSVSGSTTLGPQTTFLSTTLSAAVTTTSATTISVSSKTNFPTTYPFTIQVDTEQMSVTGSPNGTTWTVSRGFNSTTKATHAANAVVGWALNSTTDTKVMVNSTTGYPTTYPFTITVDSEQMSVTASPAANTWTVTRGFNSTTKALHGGLEVIGYAITNSQTTIYVASNSGFPTSGNFTVKIDSEDMLVTAGQGGTTWTVTRGVDGTTKATHSTGATVARIVGQSDTTIQVNAPHGPGFPSVPFTIAVQNDVTTTFDYEHMTVTAVSGSSAPYTWTVTRAQDNTVVSTHGNGKTVDGTAPWTPSAATVHLYIPLGFSGTDSDSPAPSITGANGTYSAAGVPAPGTPLYKSIECISATTNGTNLATPIRMAQWWLDHYGRQGVPQGIILETDGHPQVGFESADQTATNAEFTCQAAIDAATAAKGDTTNSKDGIQIYTIGYGVDSTTRCPSIPSGTQTQKMQTADSNANMFESSTWNNALASDMLRSMATDAAHFFDNPSSSDLAVDFRKAATDLVKGHSRLIQLYPIPVVTGTGGSPSSVTISGEYFSGASKAFLGNKPCTFTAPNASNSTIVCSSAAGTSGTTVNVTVTTPAGTSFITSVSTYKYP